MSSLRNALLLGEIKPVSEGLAVRHPVEELTTDEAVEAWVLLDRLVKLLTARKEQLRAKLLGAAEAHGTKTDKGHFELHFGGHTVTRARAQATLPARDELLVLCEQRGIKVTEVCDKKEELVLNPSKVAFLVKTGKFTQAEIDELRKVTWRLDVEPDPEFGSHVDNVTELPPALKPFAKK